MQSRTAEEATEILRSASRIQGTETSSTPTKPLSAIDILGQTRVMRRIRLLHPMFLPNGSLSCSIIWATCQYQRVSFCAFAIAFDSILNSDFSGAQGCTPHHKEMCGNEVEHQMNPEHVHLLATKWPSPDDLAVLAEQEGLKYKKGKFSLSERRSIQSALDAYKAVSSSIHTLSASFQHLRQRDSKSTSDIQQMLFQRYDRTRDEMFWSELGECYVGVVSDWMTATRTLAYATPGRPLDAVYHYVRRAYQPWARQGSWGPADDDSLIEWVDSFPM
jgi:hypothetical protein